MGSFGEINLSVAEISWWIDSLPPTILFGLALHRWRIRIFDEHEKANLSKHHGENQLYSLGDRH
jgi:hypothetical protein